MTFAEHLATYIGRELQVFLTVDTIIGVLVSVNANFAVIRVGDVPGYGTQEITVLLSSISYVRVQSV
ncbi:hypothetical protein RAC89_17990 [Paenibacillus sp. GD4]|jgi:hypothetical protein|uniref:hypothetical protein n=1 Tax=Paenibacillus sp. GD4 TaxID=3068890 RepID=UPI002796BB22|nr:hypothetical protein [Paenibacillus sp. GD4]MDQ1912283.1 hypothetical protein [Paenibacillus sp. GD4]